MAPRHSLVVVFPTLPVMAIKVVRKRNRRHRYASKYRSLRKHSQRKTFFFMLEFMNCIQLRLLIPRLTAFHEKVVPKLNSEDAHQILTVDGLPKSVLPSQLGHKLGVKISFFSETVFGH